jgi:hypothetical protein
VVELTRKENSDAEQTSISSFGEVAQISGERP